MGQIRTKFLIQAAGQALWQGRKVVEVKCQIVVEDWSRISKNKWFG